MDGPTYLRERELRRRKLHREVRDACAAMVDAGPKQRENRRRTRARASRALKALDKFESERVPLAIRARSHGGD